MKTLKFMMLWFVCLAISVQTMAQQGPEDGTYFIVNVESGRALTPVDANVNSNTRLKQFNKSGMQKWSVKKHTTKGKNDTKIIVYTIRHLASDYYLRPYHVPDNGNAIISDNDTYSNFNIMQDGDNYVIKSIQMGGDAMYSKNMGFGDKEPWFAPNNDDDTYKWRFVPVE